ncbi:hypothetical protein K469DRAFT_641349 [Zopfia rhizophila CBS 207.26]|uniref:Transposase Tc1-like domain-containing protein n=1 Tax=Zopfia rhizophila CBS 207.26 TaxID=1314779 RepID=A0A6A6DJ08_9PEZI|nr:hypothetical protein K469DRAFT_641349 [Zopfia rhizophila CBS 207.26]
MCMARASNVREHLTSPQHQLTGDERTTHPNPSPGGLSISQIVDRVGVSRSTIREVIHGPTAPTKPRGCRPILDTYTRRRLVLYTTSNTRQRRKSWRRVAQELGITVSSETLAAAFHKMGYY